MQKEDEPFGRRNEGIVGMSKVKLKGRKRTLQKINLRRMSLKKEPDSTKLLKRMTRDHLDVLQNIEFTLVSCHRDDRSIDDRTIADALKVAIGGDLSEHSGPQSLAEGLDRIRQVRSDVSDDIWRAGLQTVLQSVRRHSSLKPGDRGYLNFVSSFVP
ncbi:MAG: hypothetical protein ACYS0H_16955 [Planctomycetota bacterium]|jgi:hypothetical protein